MYSLSWLKRGLSTPALFSREITAERGNHQLPEVEEETVTKRLEQLGHA